MYIRKAQESFERNFLPKSEAFVWLKYSSLALRVYRK